MLNRPILKKANPPEEREQRYFRIFASALEVLLIRARDQDRLAKTTHSLLSVPENDIVWAAQNIARFGRALLWILVFVAIACLIVGSAIFVQIIVASRADRPYVSISNDNANVSWKPITDPQFEGLGRVVWTWAMTNYGRELAVGVSHSDVLALNWNLQRRGNFGAATRPVPVASNMKMYEQSISNEVMTRAAFDWAMATEGVINLRAKITYSDKYGNNYETDVCQFHRPDNGAAGNCYGNNMR
jgi:hypothetical protein